MADFFRRAAPPRSPSEADPALDVAFYKGFYTDLAPLSDAAAAQHWHQHGRREKRLPSAQAAVFGHANFPRLPEDFDPADYVYLNRDLPERYYNAFDATMHFLVFGLGEARPHRAARTDEPFLAFMADAHPRAQGALELVDARLKWCPRGLDQFLYFLGFGDTGFLDLFDVDFYFNTSGIAKTPGNRSRFATIVHFGTTGAGELSPINEHLVFDPFYYRKLVRFGFGEGLAQTSDADLYKRWLSDRDFATYPPNHRQHLQNRFGVGNSGVELLDLEAYRFANADLRTLDDEALLEQLFGDGLTEQRFRIDETNVALFTRLADHLQHQGQLAEAERIYFRLAHFVPNYPGLNQRLGDHLVRRERYAEAFRYYDRNIERGQASKWAYLNAATCCERLSDLKTGLATLDAGVRAYPDDQWIARQRGAMAERYFDDEFHYARAVASAGRIAEAQERLSAAARHCDQPLASEAPARPIRTVALFANMDLSQCTLYRVEQKAEQLLAAGFAVKIFDWSAERDAFERTMAAYDCVIFYRVAAFAGIVHLINRARAAGLVTVYEIDDLIFDRTEFPDPHADYAGQITSDEYVDICLGVPLFRYALDMCDYAIASTPALAERMEPLVRKSRAFVHRNALGQRHERAMAEAKPGADGPVTIFYGSGTKAHKGDFQTILMPALEEIDRRFGDEVRFVFAGHRPAVAEGLMSRAEFVPFTSDVADFWAALSQADINLSVLRCTAATDAKSEIKWLEAAMFAIPSVVSATQTFREVITDGVDGFLAGSTADFVDKIALLVRDKARRASVGAAAKAKALRDYGNAALADNLRAVLGALVPPAAAPARIRVLVVNVFYPPQTKGGATRVVVDNVSDIRDMYPDDFEFEVFTTLEGGTHPYEVHVASHEGIRTTAMTAGSYPEVDQAAIDGRAGEVFRACVERFAPDLIHFHCIQRISAAATEVALLAKIPYVITAHDGWWICDRQFLFDNKGPAPRYDFGQIMRNRFGLDQTAYDRPLQLLPSLRGAEAILAVSAPFAAIYRGTGLTNVRALPNGMPRVSLDAKAPVRAADPSRKLCVAHIGGTSAHKGFDLFKYAIFAARPKNLCVLVVELGLEPGEEQVQDWNGTAVRIVAKRPQGEINALYGEIDVLFAPSLWPESYGLVTREALAAGCWVVASDRGAVGEPVVEGKNGHIVAVDTLDGLVEVIGRLDADTARYKARPPALPPQRTSRDQARDLAALYHEIARRP